MNDIIRAATPVAAAVAIVAFALPTYIGVLRLKGFGRGLVTLVGLGVFTLAVLTAAVKTGLPFDKFHFGDALGYKLLDAAPWTLAFAYPPLLLGAFWLARKVTDSKWAILLTTLFALGINIVLDPALTRMQLWSWETAGPFYGVPVLNFAGWFGVWLVGSLLLTRLWGDTPTKRSLGYSLFAIVWFWAGVNLGLQQWLPGILGVVAGGMVIILMWNEKRRERKATKA